MEKLAYRADVDGLRAVAVLAVIAAHLPEKFLPSGFLGVDVFFAISGFVVTASLLSQKSTRLVPLYSGFLTRRIKRLLPALTVCVAVTSTVVLLTDPFPAASINAGLAALFGFANIVLFFFELDYFSPSSLFNAFTHTWSLGVEEQFYVVFPMFVWLFYYRMSKASVKALALAMVVGGLVSLGLFTLLYEDHRAAAFFLMPARIWELGVGALVFLGARQLKTERLQNILRRISPIALLVLLGCFLVPEHNAMPATVAAVACTAVLLANWGQSASTKFLALKPVVYVGKISYSLYLWHWPIIALGPIVLSASWRSSAVYFSVAFVAAIISYHVVEKPMRFRPWTGRHWSDIASAVAVNSVLAVVLLLAIARTETASHYVRAALHPPPYLPLIGSGKSHKMTCALDGGSRQLQPDTIDNCTVPPTPGSGLPTIWTMGDSHSGHLQGLLYELHERLGVGVHLVETPGWSFPFDSGKSFAPREILFKAISPRMKPGDIVLIARIYISRSEPHEVQDIQSWLTSVAQLADDLASKGVKLVITGPPPIFPFKDIRECSLDERESCRLERKIFAPLVADVMEQLNRIAKTHNNVAVFEIFNSVCPPNDSYCYPDNGHSFLYRDKDHFNSLGSRLLADRFVDMLRTSNMLTPGG